MKIQSLLFLGVASFALAHANAQVDNGGYGFTEERGAATQSSGAVEPTFELLRTSYVAPASPSASALAPTAAGAPMILTPVVPVATPASTKSGCASACNAMFKPVCGSDGKTYSNSCMLSVAQCKNPDAKIIQKAEGACVTDSTTPASTPAATTPGGSGSTLPTTAPVGETTPAPTQSTEQPAPGTPEPSESKCTQMCSSDFTPLCGSDGKTYSNACALSVAQCKSPSANISKVADGECASGSSDSATPAPATPVTTPETPASAPSPASEAPAPAPPATCTQMCTFDIAPVCGSDGKTYSNECALSVAQCKSPSANLAKVADGECASGSSGSATPVPENPAPASEAPAPATPAKCEKMCTADYKPVCGSNGKTYSNACMLSIAQCGSPSVSITKASDGECSSGDGTTPAPGTPATETPATPAAGGTSTPAPVSAPSVTKPAKGNTSKCEMACTKSYAPVCGSNGKTYNNVCLLRLANCKSGSKKTITIKSQGACSKGSSGSDTAKPSGSSGVIQAPATTDTSTSGGATSTTSTTTSTASGVSPSSPSSSTSTSATTSTSTSTSTTGTSTGTTGSMPGETASYLRGNGAGKTNSPYQGQ